MKFHQKDSGQVVLLSPYQSLLYTWDDPSKERSLLWNVYNNKGKDFCVPFWKDGFGEERVSFHVVCRSQQTSNETVAAMLSVGLKRLNAKSFSAEDNSSSSDDSEDETERPHVRVFQYKIANLPLKLIKVLFDLIIASTKRI